jgi:hypothetical protein
MSSTADRLEREHTETVMIDLEVVRERARQIRKRVSEATEVVERAVAEARRTRGDGAGAYGLANAISNFSSAFSGFVVVLGQECEEIALALDTVANDAETFDRKA